MSMRVEAVGWRVVVEQLDFEELPASIQGELKDTELFMPTEAYSKQSFGHVLNVGDCQCDHQLPLEVGDYVLYALGGGQIHRAKGNRIDVITQGQVLCRLTP